MMLSFQVAGIESLVDELYTKLQEQQAAQLGRLPPYRCCLVCCSRSSSVADVSDAAVNCTHATPAVNDPYESSDSVISSSSEDPAERYATCSCSEHLLMLFLNFFPSGTTLRSLL